MKVSDKIIALLVNILCVALGVKGVIFRHQAFRRMILGYIFTLRTGNCCRVEHIFRAAAAPAQGGQDRRQGSVPRQSIPAGRCAQWASWQMRKPSGVLVMCSLILLP